jgi:hypothetical protein
MDDALDGILDHWLQHVDTLEEYEPGKVHNYKERKERKAEAVTATP